MKNKNKLTHDMTFSHYIGSKGEQAAVTYLQREGFSILGRNYAVHNVGEIDIIAEKEDDVYIFEVRTRLNIGTFPDAAESVMYSKRKKVIRTAERFLNELGMEDKNIVFEVIKITHDKQGNILRIDFVPF